MDLCIRGICRLKKEEGKTYCWNRGTGYLSENESLMAVWTVSKWVIFNTHDDGRTPVEKKKRVRGFRSLLDVCCPSVRGRLGCL